MLVGTTKTRIGKRTTRSHRKKQPKFMRFAKRISYGLGRIVGVVILPIVVEFLKGFLQLPAK